MESCQEFVKVFSSLFTIPDFRNDKNMLILFQGNELSSVKVKITQGKE